MGKALETFLAQVEARTGAGLPAFIKGAFEAFLERGILGHGLRRVRCADCTVRYVIDMDAVNPLSSLQVAACSCRQLVCEELNYTLFRVFTCFLIGRRRHAAAGMHPIGHFRPDAFSGYAGTIKVMECVRVSDDLHGFAAGRHRGGKHLARGGRRPVVRFTDQQQQRRIGAKFLQSFRLARAVGIESDGGGVTHIAFWRRGDGGKYAASTMRPAQ